MNAQMKPHCAGCDGRLETGEIRDVEFPDETVQSCLHCHEELEEQAREAWLSLDQEEI